MNKELQNEYDVIIIGGGVAGLSAALSLKDTNLKILLLERKVKYIDVNRGDTLYPHSLDILQKWNVLDSLIAKGAVKSHQFQIFRNNDDTLNVNIVDNTSYNNKFLLSLNHEQIEQSLYDNLLKCENITIVLGANVTKVTESVLGYESILLKHNGEDMIIKAHLFIGCDGRDSFLRKMSEIEYVTQDFIHDIIILTSTHPFEYNNQTWLVYGRQHEILVGPLPDNKCRLSVIVKKDQTSLWMKMNEQEIEAAIKNESLLFDDCVIQKNESHIYEIKMSLAQKFYDRNLVLLGDSAHTVHPISGQGMALAISDAYLLANLIKNFITTHELSISEAIKISAAYNSERRVIVEKLQKEVANLGNLLVSDSIKYFIPRLFLTNIAPKLPFFEYEIENMVKSEVEKF